MEKVIYLRKDELLKAVSHVAEHFGENYDNKLSPMLLLGFTLFGVELSHYLEDNYTVNVPNNDSENLDFPNSK